VVTLGAIVIAVCLIGIAVGRSVPALDAIGLLGSSVLVTILAWVIWTFLIYTRWVPVDEILGACGLRPWEPEFLAWFRVLFLGPPLLIGAVFAWRRWRRGAAGRKGTS
jgi:hypothetical protein